MKALVTGASGGIGMYIAEYLAIKGFDLVLTARNKVKLDELKDKLANTGVKIDTFSIDLSKSGSASELYAFTKSNNHIIDFLVNNAGFGCFGEHEKIETETLENMLNLNITQLTVMCALYGKDMAEKGSGIVLNTASTASYLPMPYFAAYAASKTYTARFSKALSAEYAGKGINVSWLSPGATDTGFFDTANPKTDTGIFKKQFMMNPRIVAKIAVEETLKGKSEIIPGTMNKLIKFIAPCFPLFLIEKALKTSLK